MSRTDDPIARVVQLRATRMPDTVVMSRLILEGWSETDIRAAFSRIPQVLAEDTLAAPPTPAMADRSVEEPTPSVLKTIHAYSSIALAFAALAALGFAAYVMWRPPVVYSISIPASSSTSTLATLTYGALPQLSDPDYYGAVKQNLISQEVSFIDADLSSMQLTVYINGTSTLQVPILAKGKVGSWWETPAGIYKIETKESDHFSSFGNVHMPYSMEFQGNFFIHGWPYYDDGTPVATSYSGGCIRLSTDDAKKVYALVDVGMPVVVYNAESAPDTFHYQLKVPPLSASGYLVADVGNGTVLASKNAGVAAPIASISKLITALVASEYINLDKTITVPESAIVYTSVPRLKPGQVVRAYDLLFLLLQESSNEAAETLASAVGREQFVAHMNEKASAIGLTNTVFSDPSGAKGDYATPEDLFTLARYIDDNRKFVFGITSGDIKGSAYGPVQFKNIQNFNIIKDAPATLVGGKIGQTTEAAETYAGIFSVQIGDQSREIAVIVLGSQDSQGDVRALLQFVHTLFASGDPTTGQGIEATSTALQGP